MDNFPRIKSVITRAEKRLRVQFENGVIKFYDCRPLLKSPPFQPLKDEAFFKNVAVDKGGYGIIWNEQLDLSEAELWVNGVLESP